MIVIIITIITVLVVMIITVIIIVLVIIKKKTSIGLKYIKVFTMERSEYCIGQGGSRVKGPNARALVCLGLQCGVWCGLRWSSCGSCVAAVTI